ncbi:MAG: methylmalonyl-CoA mutase, partial [Methanobacteriota archaeon]
VSICTVDDMERLYAGFDLCDPSTSVSMTINGPAPIMLAFFFTTAIRQQCRKWVVDQGLLSPAEAFVRTGDGRYGFNVHSGEWWVVDENTPPLKPWEEIRKLIPDEVYEELKAKAMSVVRGTVQADILKEDQAQNTCIFSTDFSLRMMGDIQEFFVENNVKNYYSVSISGYHIAEAGANPITQVAFTLANGFTYLEYYLSRGLHIDDFAPNFSFFFSNGLDPEYSVIGRVARRIWAIAVKNKYKGNKRSQMLKYHIQTSGRSLHAQEVDFNDIRTTLQALLAIYDNCNSLHTNAYDEAVTTPTEESVRRAMAIQLIINREFGVAKNENPNQGSFIINELTELVEEAILAEFDRLTSRGGVLGAMETQYQRSKIQEESLYYETLKNTGELPIIGVNTFLDPNRKPNELEVRELVRATKEEKDMQIRRLREFQEKHKEEAQKALKKLQQVAISGGNIFAELLNTVQYCSLGQISKALYQVGGEYRRNL